MQITSKEIKCELQDASGKGI